MALLNFDGYVILPLTRTGISEILGSVWIVSCVKYPILAIIDEPSLVTLPV